MNEQCKHNNPTATCCECLTETFRSFEAAARQRREARLAVIYGIKTYQSKTLGTVTVPE